MVCYRPIAAYRAPGGSIAFDSKNGFGDKSLSLPCGKCVGCRLDRARAWSLRCAHEAMLHERNCFVTLTYRPESLPENGSLVPDHWTLFMKRLRKVYGKVRYLMAGEYGDTTFRPHYHAILFGLDFSDDRVVWQEKRGYSLFSSPRLERVWGHGFCSIGNVNRTTAEYVARYTLKKVRGDEYLYRRISEHGEEFYVEPEFARMSRNPGLGSGWYDRFKGDLYPLDECILDGRRYMTPRYYDDKLKKEDPDSYDKLRGRRARRGLRSRDIVPVAQLPQVGEDDRSPVRLAAREAVAERRVEELPRE